MAGEGEKSFARRDRLLQIEHDARKWWDEEEDIFRAESFEKTPEPGEKFYAQVIELLISPPATWNFSKEESVKLLLTGAIIMDLIWEHWNSRNTMQDPPTKEQSFKWEVPEQGWYKVNCDAAIGRKFSSIAVVVRDWRGSVVLAQSKKVDTISPLQAEASAIYWAAKIVVDHGWCFVSFESDCKQCMDAICNGLKSAPWRIQSCLAGLAELAANHSSWKFRWINRAANEASHQLADQKNHDKAKSGLGPLRKVTTKQIGAEEGYGSKSRSKKDQIKAEVSFY
uniref:RNase H type-1 domain-containing protein n=1 Tax=Fagus sylvatica TaxID=28930 RepID=A0A2N9EU35_FAGSY